MDIAEELTQLHALHQAGGLTDDEYERAKAKVLASQTPARRDPERGSVVGEMLDGSDRTLGEAANRYVSFQIVMAVIGGIIGLIMIASMMGNMR